MYIGIEAENIYADAAAATPMSKRAADELIRLLPFFGNPGSLHSEAVLAQKELEAARLSLAHSIGAHADEIILTGSGTEANNLALVGSITPWLSVYGELHVVTTAIEHPSVLEPLYALEREGLYITELGVDASGVLSLETLESAITQETIMVSVQMVNSEIGSIQPIKAIAKIIRRIRKERVAQDGESALPLYLHTDASQAPLWLDLKIESLGIDLMTLDAQKILGPKGIGLLFVKRGTDIVPTVSGGTQEYGLRAGTPNLASAGSFAVALADAQKDIETRVNAVSLVRNYLYEEIQRQVVPTPLLNGSDVSASTEHIRVANNLNLSIPGIPGDITVLGLDARGIAASTRSACKTSVEAPSHVLEAIGLTHAQATTSFRLTFLPDITKAQADRIAKALAEVALRYKTIV